MEKLSFKLEQFEGPLDLLLHLISKHKLDIYDIEIFSLVSQYIAYIEQMQDSNLEIASDFLEMAARLVHIKSVMLLPKHEEAEELKQELAGQLLEYHVIKQIAGELGDLYVGGDLFARSPDEIPVDHTYTNTHPASVIYQAMLNAIGKGQRKMPPPETAFTGIVKHKIVSVNSRIIHILRHLYKKSTIGFDSLFSHSESRSEMVATFLAVLELVKAKRVLVSEDTSTLYFQKSREA